MDIAVALRNTSKGKIHYDNQRETPIQTKKWLNELNPIPSISKYHIENCLSLNKTTPQKNKENISNNNNEDESLLYVTSYSGLSPPPKQTPPKPRSPIKQPQPVACTSPVLTQPKPDIDRICVSPEYGSSIKSIRDYEIEYERKLQITKAKKRKEFDDHEFKLSKLVAEQLVLGEKKQDDQLKKLDEQAEKHLQDKLESEKQVQVIKESHKHHSQMLDAKVLEVEKRKQQLRDEDRKRQEQLRQIVEKINSSIAIITDQFTSLYTSCQYKQFLSDVAMTIDNQIAVLKLKAEQVNTSFKSAIPSQDEIKILMKIFEECKHRLELIKPLIVEANKKGTENDEIVREKAKMEELQQKQQQPTPVSSVAKASSGVESSTKIITSEDVIVDALEEYTKLQGNLNKITESLKDFTENPQMKKYKFDLQKAVNTPLNAISPDSSSHLHDKLQRLHTLLSGHTVEVTGKRISAKEAPEGITFCKYLAAKMIVKKGAEQVSSKHETAFAIASVAVGLWCYYPDIGDLLLAHFHSACPYTVPFTLPRQDNQSLEHYHKLLGYKVEDGVIEDQDKFLKRMSGVMRLYSAILISHPPRGSNLGHPHGIEYAWLWLGRVLNTNPQPDITASMITDMLYVTGHALYEQYRNQFLKVLSCMIKEYIPKLKAVAVGGGPVSRLETFVESVIQNGGRIAKPEGLLPPNFI